MQALLVEDSPADAMLFGAYLEDAPFITQVHHAKRLSEAMEQVAGRRFDLIVLDLGLPDASELEAFHAIREAAPTSPVIVLTGLDDDVLAQQAVHDGAQDYLLKSELNEDVLTRSARYAIERSRAQRELALMQSLTMALSTAESTNDALETALALTGNASGWERGLAWMPVVGTGRWRLTASWSREGASAPIEHTDADPFDPAGSFIARVIETGDAMWVADLSADESEAFGRVCASESLGMKAALGVPIRTERETVAALALFVREVRPQDERLARLIGAALAPLGPVLARRRAEDALSEYRLHLEDLVAERTAALEASMSQLRDADRLASIGTLAAGLGHDMRNILLPIRCRLDTVEASTTAPESRGALDEVRKWLSYLEEVSTGLRDLSLDPESPIDEAESTDIADWWAEVGQLLARGIPGSVELHTAFEEPLPSVRVARHKLTQAVLNLVVNAGEAMDDPGRITVCASRVDSGHAVRVSVRDDGPGMPPAIARRAADPFFTTKTRGLSTGMGLSLVRGVVNGCGGSMRIDTVPGEGTEVILELPSTSAPPGDSETADARASVNARRVAVTLRDPRRAAFVTACLRSYDAEAIPTAADAMPDAEVWITEADEQTLESAQRLVQLHPSTKVIVFGDAPDDWHALGAHVLGERSGLAGLREMLGFVPSREATPTEDAHD